MRASKISLTLENNDKQGTSVPQNGKKLAQTSVQYRIEVLYNTVFVIVNHLKEGKVCRWPWRFLNPIVMYRNYLKMFASFPDLILEFEELEPSGIF